MSEELFRKKSLERIKTPEKIDAFIQAERTRYGLLLGALCLIVIGIAAWFFLGSLEMKISTYGVTDENGFMEVYVSEDNIQYVEVGMNIKAEGKTFGIDYYYADPIILSDEDPVLAHLCGLGEKDWCYVYVAGVDLEPGQYYVDIITDSFHPFELLFAD